MLRICITDKMGIVCGAKMPRSLIHERSFHCNGITVYLSAASADGLKFTRGSTFRRHCRQLINIASGWLTYYRRKTDGVAGLRDGEEREKGGERKRENENVCVCVCVRERGEERGGVGWPRMEIAWFEISRWEKKRIEWRDLSLKQITNG